MDGKTKSGLLSMHPLMRRFTPRASVRLADMPGQAASGALSKKEKSQWTANSFCLYR